MPLGLVLKQPVGNAIISPSLVTPWDIYYNSSSGRVWVSDTGLPNTIPVYVASSAAPAAVMGNIAGFWGTVGAGRIVGDGTYVYASCETKVAGITATNDDTVAIISESTGNIVGLCKVDSVTVSGTPYASVAFDHIFDGAGNLYVVAYALSEGIGNVQKFNIAAAIAAYPTPVASTVTSSNESGLWSVTWDPVTSQVFACGRIYIPATYYISAIVDGSPGPFTTTIPMDFVTGSHWSVNLNGSPQNYAIQPTGSGSYVFIYSGYVTVPTCGGSVFEYPSPANVIGSGGVPPNTYTGAPDGDTYAVYAFDPTTLVVSAQQYFTYGGGIPGNFPLWSIIAAGGSVWVSCSDHQLDGTNISPGLILKINPSTFPNNASTVGLPPSGFLALGVLSYDALSGIDEIATVSRVTPCMAYRLNASTNAIASSFTLAVSGSAVPNNATNTSGGMWVTAGIKILVYTNTIGSESLSHTITTY